MNKKRWLLVAVAMMSVLGFAVACSSKNNNQADTPTAAATLAETPVATSETPMGGETPTAGTPQASTVTANLVEWNVIPQPASVAAGSVTFNVKNIGSEKHSFVLIKTELPADGLPTLADGSADESQLDVIDQVPELAAGTQGTVAADLVAGNYVIICNIVDTETSHVHYQEGMHVAFTVQ